MEIKWKRKNGKDVAHLGDRVAIVKEVDGTFTTTLGAPGPGGTGYSLVALRASREAARNAGERALLGKENK